MTASTQTSTPYGDAAAAYLFAGWPSVLPLPPAAKTFPPKGFTGGNGAMPTEEQVDAWIQSRPDANIALRLPETVIGIDVDAYGSKLGAQTLADAEARWGALPPTFMSSSRELAAGAIRYFKIPAGLSLASWVGDPDGGIEIIRYGHRYAVAPPSIHPEGRVYRWFTPAGEPTDEIPSPEDFADLPAAWIEGLTVASTKRTYATAADVEKFLAGLPDGDPDADARRIVNEFHDFLDSARAGRHEEMLRVTWELVVAGATGARGVPTALAEAESLFVHARSDTGTPAGEAEREWARGLSGAVAHLAEVAPPLEPFILTAAEEATLRRIMDEARAAKVTYDRKSTSDSHLSTRVAHEHLRGLWSWSSALGWLQWDGRRWRPVKEQHAREAVRKALLVLHREDMAMASKELKATQDKLNDDLASSPESEQRAIQGQINQAAKDHAERVRQIGSYLTFTKIRNVMALVQGQIAEDGEKFDARPELLNVANGVVDLHTGELLPHHPEYFFTKLSSVAYRPEAVHADWDAALQAVPAESREWLRVRFGQAATGFTPDDDVVPFLYGGGSNGKSTVVLGVTKALGEFATFIPDKVLLLNPGDHPTEMMTLFGARLALLEELPQGRFLDAKRLKTVAGTGMITARYTGRDNISWAPTHSLFVTTNYELRVDENDHGTWRRLARVPFPYKFGAELPKDAGLRPRLERGEEGQHEAVLAWLVSGAVDWFKAGRVLPPMPGDVAASTREWRGTADVLGRFLDEVTEQDEGSAVLARELFDTFKDWAADHGHRPWTDQLFWERFKSHDLVASGAVDKRVGRIGARSLSSRALAANAPATKGTQRLVFGLRFQS